MTTLTVGIAIVLLNTPWYKFQTLLKLLIG
jgi:hypothetical protein